MHLLAARLHPSNSIRIDFSDPPAALSGADIFLAPAAPIRSFRIEGHSAIITTDSLDPSRSYTVFVRGVGMMTLDPMPWLEQQKTAERLGCTLEENRLVFRLFAPRASRVRLHLFEHVEDSVGDEYTMKRREEGVWELSIEHDPTDAFYAYSINGPRGEGEQFNPQILVPDPYSIAAVSKNTFRHEARTLLPSKLQKYSWGDDSHLTVAPEDLVLYELHVRDMTIHPSSGVPRDIAGTYRGLVHDGASGGFAHLRSLGVNAVELMPCQQFAWMEPPYKRKTSGNIYNHWNPYERNHWGYMTSLYFAPEARYASGALLDEGAWNNVHGRQCVEFRDMVKAFHAAGIAVILDVVYNHTSQYDYQPLKYLDRKYYYRLDAHGNFINGSGCGNDVHTARPVARKLILDSIRHWLEYYHVDGFRFDLAAMIDEETLASIREEAQRIHPGVLLIAEPWGGDRYDPSGFSDLGYLSWNDVFRNGVKGWDPVHASGFVFGHWGANSPSDYGKWVCGSIREKGGPFARHAHALNYLESHDGYTLGDFIRIVDGSVRPGQQIGDMQHYAQLTDRQLKIARLAAFMLLTSRGAVMLHAGQEFARGKVIVDRGIPDVLPRTVDANSYEKDDETNWLDYSVADYNNKLLEYYRGLIMMRDALPSLRRGTSEACRFLVPDIPIASGYILEDDGKRELLAVLTNANQHEVATYDLDAELDWEVLADETRAGMQVLAMQRGGGVRVPPCSAMLLRAVIRV